MEKLLTVKDLSQKLQVHINSIYRMVREGRIPFVKARGIGIRFVEEKIDRFLADPYHKQEALIELFRVDFSLEAYDRLFLKGGEKALSKNSRHWHYAFGSLFLRKTKEGKDRFYLDYRDQGKRIREVVKHAQNRGEALLALQRKTSEIFDGKFHPRRKAENLVFKNLASPYLENYAKPYKRSWKSDSSCLNAHLLPFFGDYLLSDISQHAIEQYITQRISDGVQKSTINRELACLKKMLNKAID